MAVDGGASGPKKRRTFLSQRDKVLVPNGHTVRFLYLMLKQIDTRQIDWQKVADGTGIATSASARNRYSRFKKQIESQIEGDMIQAKREQKEEDDTSDNFNFNSIPATPARVENAGIDAPRRIKTEPGIMQANAQYLGQQTRHSFANLAGNDDLTDSTSISASSTPSIKREQNFYDDFGSSLIKREKSIDNDIPLARGNLCSSSYDSSPISTYGNVSRSAFLTRPPITSSPLLPSPTQRQNIPPSIRRTIPSSSSLPSFSVPFAPRQAAAPKASTYLPVTSTQSTQSLSSSPPQPKLPSPLPQYRPRIYRESIETARPRPVAVHPLSPFYIPRENHTQSSGFNSGTMKLGNSGQGSAEEPFNLEG